MNFIFTNIKLVIQLNLIYCEFDFLMYILQILFETTVTYQVTKNSETEIMIALKNEDSN